MALPAPTEPALEAPPLGLYVHLPWCVRKCPYCDFNSHRAPAELPVRSYLDALLRDLEYEAVAVAGRTVETIFFGGGTPSLFPPDAFAEFLAAASRHLALAPDVEVTLEANPGTLEHAPFDAYLAAGIGRLSLGVQSFDPAALAALGRVHDGDQARAALEGALGAGFTRVNVDLMFGLPGQGIDDALADLRTVLALDPGHVSHYQLTIEPNTLFHARPPALPDSDLTWEMQSACQVLLGEAGYERYEVSAHARRGHACRHNLNYWRFGDYLGVGAGAHGKLTDPCRGEIRRSMKQRQPRAFQACAGSPRAVVAQRPVAEGERCFEFVLNALRLRRGFHLDAFRRRTGLEPDLDLPPWDGLIREGLVLREGDRLRASDRGFRFLDTVLERFLDACPDGEPGPGSDGGAAAPGPARAGIP